MVVTQILVKYILITDIPLKYKYKYSKDKIVWQCSSSPSIWSQDQNLSLKRTHKKLDFGKDSRIRTNVLSHLYIIDIFQHEHDSKLIYRMSHKSQ